MATSWSDTEAKLVQLLLQQGKNSEDIRKELSKLEVPRTQKAIQRFIARQQAKGLPGWHAMVDVNPACAKRFNEPLRVEADKALLLSDIHCPFHDHRWVNALIDLALSYGIEHVILGGDLVDFDAFSKYGRQERVEAEDEITSAAQLVTTLAETFHSVAYFCGNHEMRLPRRADNLLAVRDAMEMFVKRPNVTISDYFWCELHSAGQKFHFEHPKNVSIHATVVPKKLASKYLCHAIAGHGHTWGMSRDVSDHFWAIDSGVCCDPRRLAYTTKVHSTRPLEVQGAVMVLDGIPILVSPDNLDFYKKSRS